MNEQGDNPLQPHELVEAGLGGAFGPDVAAPLPLPSLNILDIDPTKQETPKMPIDYSTAPGQGPMFTPDEDVTEETEDGRLIQKAVKGVPMPLAEAEALGLVKPGQAARAEAKQAEANAEAQAEAAKLAKAAEGASERKPAQGAQETK